MSKLIELTELNSENFLEMLIDEDIVIYENIMGAKIFFRFDGDDFHLKNGNIKGLPVNKVDLAIQKYYNKAYNYLESIDVRAKRLCDNNWWFCCEYFPDEKPSHIRYDKLPDNNLILTSIIKNGEYTFNIKELYEYSELLGIEPLPILFYGKLSDSQLELINYFLNTKKDDIEYLFGEENINFPQFFYKILNPKVENSFLMDTGKFEDSIDKLIIKFDNKKELSFAILNPLYDNNKNKTGDYVDTYSILISDFLEYIQLIDIDKRLINGNNSDDLYLELISDIFNSYIEDREERIVNFDFIVPPYFNDDKYKINIDLVTNKKTRYYLLKSDKIEYLFKIILSSFRYRKNKPVGVLNNNLIRIFNETVDKISFIIDRALRIEKEEELSKHNLIDFGTFFNIKYPKDAEGKVYPDLYKKLEDDLYNQNKKKGY